MEILRYFPLRIREKINIKIGQDYNSLEEIRIRVNCPIILKFNNKEELIEEKITNEDTKEILQYVCENSIYAYQNEINHGYITIKGGHRVGITGNCIIENDKVINISYIYSLNFRIAKQTIGSANEIIKHIIDIDNNDINFKGKTIGVADERGEISAMYKGIPQNDVGIRTDILDNVPKGIGMEMLIRSMAPQIIVADEIGNLEDVNAINYATSCGIKGIFTAHGETIEDINTNLYLKKIIDLNIFQRIIFLDKSNKGRIKNIYHLDKLETDSSKKYKQWIYIFRKGKSKW